MTPNEMVHRIATYIIAPYGDPVAHVQRQMYQLYTDGITSFTLEDGGILTLNYDEGNYPTIQLSDGAELEYPLIRYIAEWLDYNWKNGQVTPLKPYRSVTGLYRHKVDLSHLRLSLYSDTPKLFTPGTLEI